jgi:hypothetical protein
LVAAGLLPHAAFALEVRPRLDSEWALYASENVFWDLGARVGAADATLDADFGERWLEPGFDFTSAYAEGTIYGGLSVGASGTWRTDPLGAEGRSAAAFENAYVGWRHALDDHPVPGQRFGATYFKVTNSEQVYPRADQPLQFIERGRDGLETLHGRAEFNPAPAAAPFLGARIESAWQRNDRIALRARGVSAEVNWLFASTRFTPKVSYSWTLFSGDDSATAPRYERFDPMYYGGSLDTYWYGANAAFALLNSNVRTQRLSMLLVASPRDFVKFQWLDFHVDELRSPLQFGQITQLQTGDGGISLVSGVTEPHLANEVYGEWARMLAPNVALTGVLSWAKPGDGYEAVNAGRNRLRNWTTLGLVMSWSLPAPGVALREQPSDALHREPRPQHGAADRRAWGQREQSRRGRQPCRPAHPGPGRHRIQPHRRRRRPVGVHR